MMKQWSAVGSFTGGRRRDSGGISLVKAYLQD